MINYIINTNLGGVTSPSSELNAKSALGLIKKICIKNLFSLESYLKAVKSQLKIGHKVPIFMNYNQIFIYPHGLNQYENIFINYVEIKNVIDLKNQIELEFKNGEKIKIKMTIKQYKRLVMTIFILYEYKESLV